MEDDEIIDEIHRGEVGVIPTDTLYGIVGSALLPDTVSRIYELKKRDPDKPLIVLIPRIEELERFGVVVSDALYERLQRHWPGPVSIVLPTIDETFSYLDRGTGSIAFRLPDDPELQAFLEATGPLVAPSANLEGRPPARTIDEAKETFGSSVSFYKDGGRKEGPSSTIVRIDEEGHETILRSA